MSGSELLPVTDPELVHQCQAEYDSFFRSGTQKDVDAARFRLVWAQVHSSDERQVARGLELARTKLRERNQMEEKDVKEFTYLMSVGCYRLGKYVEARKELKALLEAHPDFRQAESLKQACDDVILKEGMLGVGIGAAVLGVGLAILFGSRK